MNRYILRNSKGTVLASIWRTLKEIPLYEIHYKKAVDDIGWPSKRRVPFTETSLFVYVLCGTEEVKKFREWAEEIDANGVF